MLDKLFGKKIEFKELRKDFPFLERKINEQPIIYFDNACMSIRPKQVLKKMEEYYYKYSGCAGRSNHQISKEAEEAVDEARGRIANFFGAKKEAVIFTKNCTEAINLVANSFPFKNGEVVLTSDKEHNSNLIPWLKLQKKWLIKHDVIHSGPKNEFSLDELIKKLNQHKDKVKLVSVVYTSNLDGVTNPVKDIIRLAHKHNAKVLLDCAQAVMHQEINIKKLEADFIALSGHKMLGPNGIGVLISTPENLALLDQFMVGGETVQDSSYDDYVPEKIPERFEAGLQNYPGIIGFGEAIKYLDNIGINNIKKHLYELNEAATRGLSENKKVKILGPKEAEKRGGVVSFIIEGKKVHEVSLLLNNPHNIMVRSGRHCVHSWFNAENNKNSTFKEGTVRASFGLYNTLEEVKEFVSAVKKISEL